MRSLFPGTPTVILPTIPRYKSGGCCGTSGHSDNAGSSKHALEMTEKVAHLSVQIIKEARKKVCTLWRKPGRKFASCEGSQGESVQIMKEAREKVCKLWGEPGRKCASCEGSQGESVQIVKEGNKCVSCEGSRQCIMYIQYIIQFVKPENMMITWYWLLFL